MAKKVEFLPADASNGEYTPKQPDVIELGDADSERSWDQWIEALRSSEGAGTIRAYRLPVDEQGNAITNAKGSRQEYLHHWPHDQYTFEELIDRIKQDYLEPGEKAFIRLQGTVNGQKGVIFNKLVPIRRAKVDSPNSGGTDFARILAVLTDSQNKQALMMERIIRPDATTPIPATPVNWQGIAAIAVPAAVSIVTALISRPAKPASDIAGLISAMTEMKSFITGDKSEDSIDEGVLGIVKAVAPAATELLKAFQLTAGVQSQQPMAPPQARLPNPNAWPHPAPAPVQNSRPPASPAIPPTERPLHKPVTITPEENQMLNEIRKHIVEDMIPLAVAGADPKEAAQGILPLLPEPIVEKLATVIGSEMTYKMLKVGIPEMAPHSEWFDKLRVALEELLYEDSND